MGFGQNVRGYDQVRCVQKGSGRTVRHQQTVAVGEEMVPIIVAGDRFGFIIGCRRSIGHVFHIGNGKGCARIGKGQEPHHFVLARPRIHPIFIIIIIRTLLVPYHSQRRRRLDSHLSGGGILTAIKVHGWSDIGQATKARRQAQGNERKGNGNEKSTAQSETIRRR